MSYLAKYAMAACFAAAVIIAAVFSFMDGEMSVSALNGADEGHTLVIDAGHGGDDGGAVGAGGLTESALNLSIAEKVDALCGFVGLKSVMTRTSEDISYPEGLSTAKRKLFDQDSRLDIISKTPGAVLLSIHQNKYTSASPRGPQVFFGKVRGSDEFAVLAQERLNACLYPQNRRAAAKISEDIYLMKNADCPAVLAECGFISNHTEAALLSDGGYQKKIALCLVSAYTGFLG